MKRKEFLKIIGVAGAASVITPLSVAKAIEEKKPKGSLCHSQSVNKVAVDGKEVDFRMEWHVSVNGPDPFSRLDECKDFQIVTDPKYCGKDGNTFNSSKWKKDQGIPEDTPIWVGWSVIPIGDVGWTKEPLK